MKLQRAKGTKDLPPEEKIVQQEVIDVLRNTFELYGFSPLETPLLERLDTLTQKYAGGSEILKETFKLKDQGNRELGLRYDLTIPFSRFVGMNPNLKMPFKRYQIGRVFRDGPVSSERVREFWQCDIDVVGSRSMATDSEFIKIAQTVFKKLELNITIKVNNRKILDGILEYMEIPKDNRMNIILTIDKVDKLTQKEINKELEEKSLTKRQIEKLFDLIYIEEKDNKKIIEKLKQTISDNEGLKEIEELLSYVRTKNVEFVPSLARGLAYYTGTVFEIFLNSKEFKTSLGAGGRYDNLIGDYLGSKMKFPAVGISFGLYRIMEVLKQRKKELRKSVAQLYIIPIKTLNESLEIAEKLRSSGIKTDMDLQGKGPTKNLNYANSLGIPFVLFIGEKELKENKLKLKNMKTGEEALLSIEDIKEQLQTRV